MNDSYANVYINKIKRKEKRISLNHRRAKYDYSITEANNNTHPAKGRDIEIDNETRIHTDTNHINPSKYTSEPKARQKPLSKSLTHWEDLIAIYDEVINVLLYHIIELTEESMFNAIKSNTISHFNQFAKKRKFPELFEHLIIVFDKAKYVHDRKSNCINTSHSLLNKSDNELKAPKEKSRDLKLSLDYSSSHFNHDRLFKRNKSSNPGLKNKEKNRTITKTNTITSPHLNSFNNKPLTVSNQYNTVKSPKLKSNLSTPKNIVTNLKSNHCAFNYFSNLIQRDSKCKGNNNQRKNDKSDLNEIKQQNHLIAHRKNGYYKSINLSNLRHEISLSPIKTSQLLNNNSSNVIIPQEETASSKSKEVNIELLSQIKSSLDDNLKVMFNFSYESFLNKESERESKYSNED